MRRAPFDKINCARLDFQFVRSDQPVSPVRGSLSTSDDVAERLANAAKCSWAFRRRASSASVSAGPFRREQAASRARGL